MKARLSGKREYELRKQIEAHIAELNMLASFPLQAQYVLNIFTGCPRHLWQSIDDAGGNAALPKDAQAKFHVVRQVRNHPQFGKQLFDVLK